MKPETEKTFKVAIALCLTCSVVVSALAVGLKPIQEKNKDAFRQQSVLDAAQLWERGGKPAELFERYMEPVGLDFEDDKLEDIDDPNAAKFSTEQSLQNEALHDDIPPMEDMAGIKEVEKFTVFYRVNEAAAKKIEGMEASEDVRVLVLPIRGKGLWSTLYGYLAIKIGLNKGPEAIEVVGLTFYKHGETPGLGGEVENELWKDKWPGKKVFNADWEVKLAVSKGTNIPEEYRVDALSGATLTSNGVTNMLRFWLGPRGFGPYLKSIAGTGSAADEQIEAVPTVQL
jgi:Na+-transporting NADH:ubiquinone oxidoreductase subunit C